MTIMYVDVDMIWWDIQKPAMPNSVCAYVAVKTPQPYIQVYGDNMKMLSVGFFAYRVAYEMKRRDKQTIRYVLNSLLLIGGKVLPKA